MRNFRNKLLISMLLLFGTTFISAEVIKIPPIVIHSDIKQENSPDSTTSILSTLKRAISKNKKSHKISKEEEVKEILERLKKSMPTQAQPSPHKVKKQKKEIRPVKKKPKIKVVKKSIKKKIRPIKKKIKIKVVKNNSKILTLKAKKVSSKSTEPLGFVKTLGVIGNSSIYEANDLFMDKREEIFNDGVVDISTATTDELKDLPFVQPLEVIEVTQPFEASEAKKYQLNKR